MSTCIANLLPDHLIREELRKGNTTEVADENTCIIAKSEATKNKHTWVLISTTFSETLHYRQLVNIHGREDRHLYLTSTNIYNLHRSSASVTKPEVQSELYVQDKSVDTFVPQFAVNVKLALVESHVKTEVSIIDNCLKSYFQIDRYLHVGDLICVNVCTYFPQAVYSENKHFVENLYFRVEVLEGPSYKNADNIIYGYLVSSECTTLHQVQSVQCFLPSTEFAGRSFDDTYSVIPSGLEATYNKLEESVLPFLSMKMEDIKLSPVFLLHGKSGTGKSTLLSAFARKNGLHYWRENCMSIQNSNPAQTESVINNIFVKSATVSPSILHLCHVEALCQDESGNKDDRTVSYFIKQIKSMKPKSPIIIFCTTSQQLKLIPVLQRVFLQQIAVEVLNFEARKASLNWLSKQQRLRVENVDEIARSAANYVFSDLVQLISRTLKISFQRASSLNKKTEEIACVSEQSWDYSIYEYVLRKEDFSEALNEMSKSYADSIGAPEIPNVTWDDVGGLAHLKERILSALLTPILPNGLHRSGLLLYGPPGTGKTLLAKAVATECKYNFLSVKGPELLNMYVGQSEKNVREVFATARESSPCIIFFDELDSLAPRRGQSGGSGSVMDRVVSQLLAEMDGIQKTSNIFILAATNRPDLIDSALLRPGRLDEMLYVGSCNDTKSKLSVLKALTRKFKFTDDVNLEQLLSTLPEDGEITGADFYGICSNAWLSAARRYIKNRQTDKFEKDIQEPDMLVCVSQEDMLYAFTEFKVKNL